MNAFKKTVNFFMGPQTAPSVGSSPTTWCWL